MVETRAIVIGLVLGSAFALSAHADDCFGMQPDIFPPSEVFEARFLNPPGGLTLGGERAYANFLQSLQPGDVYWRPDGMWVITDESKVFDLLLHMPLTDWSPQLQELTTSFFDRRLGIELREDASINSAGDVIKDRVVDEVPTWLQFTLGVAYGIREGGKVRLYQKKWGDHTRFKLNYRWEPDGDHRPSIGYEYRPADRLSLDLRLEEDRSGLGFQYRLRSQPATFSLTANEDAVWLWYRARLR